MTQTHSLAQYLEALSNASATDGPFTVEELGETTAQAMNGAFADFAHAAVAFVNQAEPVIGYTDVRRTLEDFVHTFPVDKEPNPFAMIAALLGVNPEDFVALALEDGEDENALEDKATDSAL
jgi:hypothetical protein